MNLTICLKEQMAPPKMKECKECNMYGTTEAFDSDGICKSCKKIKELEREINDLKDMFDTKSLPKILEKEIEKLKVNSKKLEKKITKKIFDLNVESVEKRIKLAGEEAFMNAFKENEETWSMVVGKKVGNELRIVSDKVKNVEEKMKIREEEDKQKEFRKNNIVIHRMVETPVPESKKKNREDRKAIITLINKVLKVPCEEKELKRVFRLGKAKDTDRPLLFEF